MAKSPIIVGGYAFFNSSDATLAETERKKVEYLHHNLNTSDPEKILAVYTKAVNEGIFKTPIGTDFLKDMQNFLIEQCDYSMDDMPPIPLYATFDSRLREESHSARARITGKKEAKEKVPFFYISIVLNIALIIGMIAMFMITLNSDNPNILNYETAILDKYSYWEEDLTTREQELRTKQQELNEREQEITAREEALEGEGKN